MSIQDELAQRMVLQSVDAQRFGADIRIRALRLLARLEKEILGELASVDLTQFQQARLQELLQQVQHAADDAYSQTDDQVAQDLVELYQHTGEMTAKTVNTTLGADLISISWTRPQVEAIVKDLLIEGAPSGQWWARQSAELSQAFGDQMRMGMLRGETMDELVKRTRDLMEISRRNAEALVRTSVVTANNAAHLAVFKENASVTQGIQWVSTLDTRTTIICRGLDGLTWDNDLKPVGHDIPFPGPTAHWGCRSTQVPWLKSWEQMAREAGGDTELARKLDQIPAGTRASMNGQVADTMTYEAWLESQSVATQQEVLGPGRYELWKKGALSLPEMLDQRGNPLTLAELRAKAR